MRYLLGLLLIVALVAGGLFLYAGRMAGPAIDIVKPAKYVGQATPVEVHVTAPQGKVTKLNVVFEQSGKQTPLFSLEKAQAATEGLQTKLAVQGGAAPTAAVLTPTITRQTL